MPSFYNINTTYMYNLSSSHFFWLVSYISLDKLKKRKLPSMAVFHHYFLATMKIVRVLIKVKNVKKKPLTKKRNFYCFG